MLRWATDDFRTRGIESPRLDAELLFAKALGATRIQLIVDAKRPLSAEELARMRELVKRRRNREPVAYILGEREFYGRTFRVDARVLVPRPDTEALVDVALARTQGLSLSMRALDLCTGSGRRPHPRARAADVDRLRRGHQRGRPRGRARQRASTRRLQRGLSPRQPVRRGRTGAPFRRHHGESSLHCIGRDSLAGARDSRARAAPRPRRRNRRSRGPTAHRRGGAAHLAAGGVLAVEIGAGEAQDVVALFEAAHFAAIEVKRDHGRIERVVSGMLSPG